jgi:tripartite-type tricarboxylate transporter receptor subunit TctC
VSIITPVPAGSGPDVIARYVADRLGKVWKQQVLILNRPGAGGLISVQAAATAKPDGYTLYMPISSTLVVLPVTHPKLPIDLSRDIVPVGLIGEQPMVVAANAKLAVRSLAELIARAKKQPGAISYGANLGGLPNLTAEVLQQRATIRLALIPYPNTAKAVQDAAAGIVQLAFESLPGLAGPIQSGMLKPLAIASTNRVPDFPDLPTFTEAAPALGVFEARGWFTLMAPAGTPDAIVSRLSTDLRGVLEQPDLQKRFASLGTYVHPMSPGETATFIRSEQELWKPVVRHAMPEAR